MWLTEHLQMNPRSRVFAIRGGNPELQGWDTQAVLTARLINTVLAVVGVKDDAAFVQYPGKAADEEVMPYKTLAEFSESAFRNFMSGG